MEDKGHVVKLTCFPIVSAKALAEECLKQDVSAISGLGTNIFGCL